MRISRDNDFFVMTHVPGPSHNYLALRFEDSDLPVVVALDSDRPAAVRSEQVLAEVLKGLAIANAALGTSYRLGEIRFCRDDTPRAGIYTEMARLLVLAMHEAH
ncbi:MAG: hypothetical protein LAT64_02840 [Phycisphaerales bacterium]|nr:hypothetical protein [Planctomycetota bacterium]MCH8507694.1 hypothetical protein [Phycisphaerales bacterium]